MDIHPLHLQQPARLPVACARVAHPDVCLPSHTILRVPALTLAREPSPVK
jgi:hypothetical protein